MSRLKRDAQLRAFSSKLTRQVGASTIEFIVAIPSLFLVLYVIIEVSLFYQAKAAVNNAALMSARAAAVNNLDEDAIRAGFIRGILPIIPGRAGVDPIIDFNVQNTLASLNPNAQIRVMNPTKEAFRDFGIVKDGKCQIPNDRLQLRGNGIGSASRINIQDSNLVKIRVTYGHRVLSPLIARLFQFRLTNLQLGTTTLDDSLDLYRGKSNFERLLLSTGRVPITATAIVRMQTPATVSGGCSNVNRDDILSRAQALAEVRN